MPVTISTVLRNSSLCTRGLFSPSSSITSVATLLTSRVSESTSATSHSPPRVGRGEPAKSMWLLAGADNTARHALSGISGGHGGFVRRRVAVDLLVALRRDVGEVVRLLVNDDRSLRTPEQILGGERVGRRHQLRGAVRANLQRRQVAACGMCRMACLLEMRTRGIEVTGRTTGRGDGAGLALANGVDVQSVEARRELTRCGRRNRDGGEAARELDVGGGHRGAIGQFQLGGELLAAGLGLAGLPVSALAGRSRRCRRAGPDRRRGAG